MVRGWSVAQGEEVVACAVGIRYEEVGLSKSQGCSGKEGCDNFGVVFMSTSVMSMGVRRH